MSFQVDDILITQSPFSGKDHLVSYRGRLGGDKAMVWTGKTQIQVPMAWLRKSD